MASSRPSHSSAPGPGDLVLAEARGLGDADTLAHRAAFIPDRTVRVRAPEGQGLDRLRALRRVPQGLLQTERGAEHRPLRLEAVVDGRAPQRPAGRALLVGERHQEAGGVGLAGHRPRVRGPRVVAEPGHVHRPGVHARIAVDHPVGEREADPAPLAEARQHAARGPVVPHLRHRSHQGVAVGGEGEGAVDDLLQPGLLERGEALEGAHEVVADPVEVVRQQLVAEVPRGRALGPRLSVLLVGADEHAPALLAHVELPAEVDDVEHLFLGLRDLGHLVGDHVLVLHRRERVHDPGHQPDLARPEPRRVHHVLGVHGALLGHHVPGAVGALGEVRHAGLAVDLGAALAGRPGVGVGHPRGVDVAFVGVVEHADVVLRVHDRQHARRLLEIDELGVEPEVAPAAARGLEVVEPVLRVGEHEAAGEVDAAGLPGDLLDLLVDLQRVVLELGDVGVGVERVHAARRMPGGAGGELRALQQDDILPAVPDEVVEDAATHDAATDDGDSDMRFHAVDLRFRTWTGSGETGRRQAYCTAPATFSPQGHFTL